MNKRNIFITVTLTIIFFSCQPGGKQYNTWTQYKGSEENIHYSSLSQIDTGNVKELQVAWEYHTGDADTANSSQVQCNPIIVNGVLFGTSPQMKLVAIEAKTGKEIWKFNPFDSLEGDKRMFFVHNNSRGVTYWSGGEKMKTRSEDSYVAFALPDKK